jgi:ubiquinone/menaquinone biosynthesis C-methylase UbiE
MSKAEAIARAMTTYNAAADHFDAPALSFWDRFGTRTIEHLMLSPGLQVLDVCCGTGASALPAARAVGASGAVLAVDVAANLLQLGQAKAAAQGLHQLEFREGNLENLGLAEESFDAIVCVFGIFFLPDMTAALQELWRMLRPGGKLAITSWGKAVFEPANQVFWQAVQAERPDLYKVYTPWDRISEPASLQALIESATGAATRVLQEVGTHPIQTPEDWWTMAIGGGCRGTIDQMDQPTQEKIRQVNLNFLEESGIRELAVEVLYAIAQKSDQINLP